MKVVVTGGAGYIGSYLVKRLLDQGVEVTSIDNMVNGDYRHLKELNNPDLRLIVGDVRNGELLHEAFEGADSIAHLAALSSLDLCREKPEEAISINIYGTFQVLEAAKRLGIRKVIFCSSASVYGAPVKMPVDESHPLRPLNLYGVTKLAAEKLAESYHLNHGMMTISLRLGNVFGLGLYTHWESVIPKFVKQGLDGIPLSIYGDGESTRDFVHIEDAVRAIMLAINFQGISGEAFNVGGEVVKIGDLAEIVSKETKKATGIEANVIHLPMRPGETKNFGYDMGKIAKVLGYKPKLAVRDGVKQLIEYRLKQMKG